MASGVFGVVRLVLPSLLPIPSLYLRTFPMAVLQRGKLTRTTPEDREAERLKLRKHGPTRSIIVRIDYL